ncbi:CcoQ/FixQ family Cbb3-type cytochrome c oxidase assembly chaperone [Endozoicomonas ascidiicola]|uniref:CcoQ/FixQ family Cbb3-type cytochrome c oxidase assembly chaperone n=1 Tax=Endozoicomonas ascidiicola TaxID=1698521 RepID=UPI0008346745|nr:CcoQ/FixQ family Cbb3-type cytochrome c oxidase assembly chaperone [Endozoicomonas ascidiicola]
MDINTIRGLATVVALIAMLSVIIWAYSSKRKGEFDEAASLPFADDSDINIPVTEHRENDNAHSGTKNSPERGVA